METTNQQPLLGGEWIIKESTLASTFIPEEFNEEQQMVKDMCDQFIDTEILPIVDRIDKMEPGLMPSLMVKAGEQGLLSTSCPEEYGGLGKDFITSTIVNEGLGGGYSFSVAIAAHTGIGTLPILYFGTEEQKQKYIPKLATGEWKGAYGLTEPNSGSDALSAKTTAVLSSDGQHYILNGQKCWITNGGFADVYTVFAKIDGEKFTGFIVERGMEGFTTPEIHGKWSLRASCTGELVFDNVKVPKENIFPNIKGLKGPLGCLSKARYGIAWGALGAAMDCYDSALRYTLQRSQFGKPIAGFQLQQKKLAEMITEITKGQLLVWRLGVLMNEGRATPAQVSMAKRNSCELALNIAREARQLHGGMGITGEYSIMRHMMNLESVITYEGTHDIHLLITGMDITGLNAFK